MGRISLNFGVVMTRFSLAALSFALGVATPALGADPNGRFALRSLATLSCGQVISAIEQSKDEGLQAFVTELSLWLGGYLTHANRVTLGVFDIVPFGAERDVLAVIVNRCEGLPPDTNFEAVTAEVVSVLSAHAVTRESPLKSGEGTIPLREAVIISVQERLIALGHLKGVPDGEFGPKTLAALHSFQRSTEMSKSSALDIDTLLALLGSE
jgi:hypothetical protein